MFFCTECYKSVLTTYTSVHSKFFHIYSWKGEFCVLQMLQKEILSFEHHLVGCITLANIQHYETPQWLILVQYTYMAKSKWMISQRRSKACLYVSVSSFLVGTQAKCLGFVSSSIFSIFSAISGDIPKTNKLMLKMLGISYASNFFCTKVVFCLKEIRLLLTIFYLKPKKTSWKHNSYYKSSYGELEHKVSWMFFILVSKWPLLLTRIWSHNTRVRNDLKFTIKIVYIVE